MIDAPFKRRDDDAATADLLDALEASAVDWPTCPACGADALVGQVDGVPLIGRPLTAVEAAAYGLRCEDCEYLTDGFPVETYHLIQ